MATLNEEEKKYLILAIILVVTLLQLTILQQQRMNMMMLATKLLWVNFFFTLVTSYYMFISRVIYISRIEIVLYFTFNIIKLIIPPVNCAYVLFVIDYMSIVLLCDIFTSVCKDFFSGGEVSAPLYVGINPID